MHRPPEILSLDALADQYVAVLRRYAKLPLGAAQLQTEEEGDFLMAIADAVDLSDPFEARQMALAVWREFYWALEGRWH